MLLSPGHRGLLLRFRQPQFLGCGSCNCTTRQCISCTFLAAARRRGAVVFGLAFTEN